jgi:hypothetical protein
VLIGVFLYNTLNMAKVEFSQWIADNDRLVIAGLSNVGPGPLDYDEDTLNAVQERCRERYGPIFGLSYYRGLIASLPQRRLDLFPELSE